MDNLHQVQLVVPPPDYTPLDYETDRIPVPMLFTRRAEESPEHLALTDHQFSYSYGELNARSNQLANGLIQILGNKSLPVGLLMGRQALSIVSVLAVLKAGKFYAGLDPTSPTDFLKEVCSDLQPAAILTTSSYMDLAKEISDTGVCVINIEDWLDVLPVNTPETSVSLKMLAAVYYTSGSTGKPKGVMVDHDGLWHRTYSSVMSLKFSSTDRTCLPFPIGFGWSTTPMLATLVTGGSLFLYDYSNKPVIDVADWLLEHRITNTPMSSSFFRQLFSSLPDTYNPRLSTAMRLIFVGGDSLNMDDLLRWKKRSIANCILAYGFSSTEAGPITRSFIGMNTDISNGTLTFGIPAPGVEILILDEDGKQVSSGVEGEIAIRSKGIMVGYWKRENLNAKKFIYDGADTESKLLLTGDMGKVDEFNNLEFVGRQDTQVKIRGYLVDLSNVKIAVSGLPFVQDVAIIPHKRGNGELRLVAYIVSKQGQIPTVKEIRNLLAQKIPSYMIPSYYCVLDDLPRSATGKINTYVLPKPSEMRPLLDTKFVEPHDGLETTVALIWKKLLELDIVGADDNFFELGGDSLLALQMTLEVEKLTSKKVPQVFFQKPTVSFLAALLEKEDHSFARQENFVVESYRRGQQHPRRNNAKKTLGVTKLRKMASRIYSLNDLDKLTDLVVARYVVSKPYPEALKWVVRWSKNPFVRYFFYHRRYTLFSRWISSLELHEVPVPELFQMSLLTNMNFGLHKYLGKKDKSIKSDLQAYKRSPHLYWKTLGELLDDTPAGQLNHFFPIDGIEHLHEAYRQGKGVILLSFHGTPTPGRSFPLERFMGLEPIQTISYHIPVSQSEYHDSLEIPDAVAATLNAEVALFAQRKLQEGRVINIVSDTNDTQGRIYKTPIAGREYQIKGGFAELALNTGATIVPHFRYCLPDGRIQLNIAPALKLGSGDRQRKIEHLLMQYAAFIENTWTTHPEAMRWEKIKKHLSRPLI